MKLVRFSIDPGIALSPVEEEIILFLVMELSGPVIDRAYRRFVGKYTGCLYPEHAFSAAPLTAVSSDFAPADIDQEIDKRAFESLALTALKCHIRSVQKTFQRIPEAISFDAAVQRFCASSGRDPAVVREYLECFGETLQPAVYGEGKPIFRKAPQLSYEQEIAAMVYFTPGGAYIPFFVMR